MEKYLGVKIFLQMNLTVSLLHFSDTGERNALERMAPSFFLWRPSWPGWTASGAALLQENGLVNDAPFLYASFLPLARRSNPF